MTSRDQFSNPEPDSGSVSISQLEELIKLQSDLLGATVTSTEGDVLLERLCFLAEKLTPGSVASIMIYDASKESLFVHTAPSIPEKAIHDLGGLKKGDGSCGNAVFYNEDMYVCDTLNDARWNPIRALAVEFGINACWSSPIRGIDHEAIGSFALSSFTVRSPDNFQRRLLRICASIAGIIFQRNESVAENEKSRKRLQRSKNNLAVTLDSITDGVISTDCSGHIIVFNKVAEKLTGYSHENAIGQHIDEIFHIVEDESERICNPVDCLTNDQACYRKGENILLISSDGTSRYVEISEALVKTEQDELSGAVVVFRDITQQRIDHEALIESQQRFRSILENTADPLFLVNECGEFVDVNQVACDNLGYSRQELLSMVVPDIQVRLPGDDFKRFFSELTFDASAAFTGRHRRKDGSEFPVEVRLRKFLSNGQMFSVALVSDITHRKEAEEELLKARKLESIGLLAGGIAHDFNNLLSIIMGNIDLATRNNDVSDVIRRYLKNASNASLRAADLTQQLLTFSKGGEPIKAATDISEIIKESADFSLHGSAIKVSYDFPDDLWTANVDSGQISQVIQNLVINARQAMPEGGNLRFICSNEKDDAFCDAPGSGRHVKIVISDNGSGISEEVINSVFDPYFTTKQEGSGLGLALSYSIISKHEGSIRVDSSIGIGTSFTICLPVTEDTGSGEKNRNREPADYRGNGLVLVMDDDEMIREIGEAMLENLGYQVLLAKDGETAFSMYQEALQSDRKIDLVIMDLTVLSGMGGKEAIRLIQEIDPDVKALVSSGYSNDDVMANHKDYGFVGAVGKPYNQDEMGAAIDAALK